MKLFILSLLILPLVARAEAPMGPVERPYKSVIYKHEKLTTNSVDKEGKPVVWPQEVFAAFIDLTDPNVQVRVSRGGEDPDGPGEWQTSLMQPTKVAEREGFDIVVNGDFFAAFKATDAEGEAALKQFTGGRPAKVSGPAVTDGEKWGPAEKARAAFMIDGRGKMVIAEVKDPPSDARQVIAGSDVIVQNGLNIAPPSDKPGFARGPHPRTAVGIRDDGKTLVLVVIDGRKKDVAVGMSLKDTADVMMKYGCTDAVNLDGGG
ncbi:MAG: hypothetical protein QOE14_3109, partial [Humisphaera sp.]|nr:hypothetical protein [Humisphaera sp.]